MVTRGTRVLVVVALFGLFAATVMPAGAAGAAPAANVASEPAQPMIVTFRGAPAAGLRSAQASVGGFTVTKSYRRIPSVRALLNPAQVEELRQQPDVARVEPDLMISIKPEMTAPTGLDTLWSPTPIRAADPGIAAAETKLGLNGDAAHDGVTTFGPADEVIAIVDSGVDSTHPDLAGGKILTFQNFVTNPDPACPTVVDPTVSWDDLGHGTHVAGIAAGTGAADPAERGVAPGAALVVLKVFDCTGSAPESQILSAFDWLLGNHATFGIDVVNMSFGGGSGGNGTDVLSRATNQLAAAGMVPVVAAGNMGPNRGTIAFPGLARYALTVGAIKSNGLGRDLTHFSSRGPVPDGRIKPDVMTPGVDIRAAGNVRFGTAQYRVLTGTSMATPAMAGLAALALQADPALAPSGTACNPVTDPVGCVDGVVDASMQSPLTTRAHAAAADWNRAGPDDEVGYGVLNAYPFLQSAAQSAVRGPRVPKHVALRGHVDLPAGEEFVAVQATKDAIVSAGVTTNLADVFTGPFAGTHVVDASGASVPAFFDCASNEVSIYVFSSCDVYGGGSRFNGLWFKAPATGTYYIGVRAIAGQTDYTIDIDGARAVTMSARKRCVYPYPERRERCPTKPLSIVTPVLAEGGPSAPVTVSLARKPAKPVQVRLAGDAQITVPSTALTFTSANWSIPQTVAVAAVDDSAVEGPHHGRVIAVATGVNFAESGISIPVGVPIADNDGPLDVPHTERVSLTDDGHESWGAQAPEAIFVWQGPLVSDNGSVVAFESRAADLGGPGAAGARTNIVVRDRTTGHTEVVARATFGDDVLEGLSADGRYVLFSSLDALVPSDTNFEWDLYLRDRTTSTLTRVNVGPNGEQMPRRNCQTNSDGWCLGIPGAISADGRSVAWITDVPMTTDDTDVLPDVFLRDLTTGTVRRVSVSSEGTGGTRSVAPLQYFMQVALSRDGSIAAFSTALDGLAPGETAGQMDLFVRDVAAGTTTLVNADATGAGMPWHSLNIPMALADNGKYVIFSATAPVYGGTVLIRNLATGAVDSVDGGTSPLASAPLGISDDGRTVAYLNCETGERPTVLRNLDSGAPPEIIAGVRAHIDSNARFAVFNSDDPNVVSGDQNWSTDTFLRILR